MPPVPPPRLARLILVLCARGRGREFVLGDIEEEYAVEIAPAVGPARARAWYWRQALASVFALWRLPHLERWAARLRRLPGAAFAESLVQDVRYGFRGFRKRPGFTAVAVVTLALGIGATTAIFSIGNRLLLRPIAGVADDDRLIKVLFAEWKPEGSVSPRDLSRLNQTALVPMVPAITGMVGTAVIGLNVAREGATPRRVSAAFVQSGYFSLLGVELTMGRGFLPEEDELAAPVPVAVISHDLWRSLFAGDPTVAGKALRVNGRRFTVVGVTPAEFHGVRRDGDVAVWFPGATYAHAHHWPTPLSADRGDGLFDEFIARLAPGATPEQAQTQLRSGLARLVEAYPDENEKFVEGDVRVYSEIGLRMPFGRMWVLRTLKVLSLVVLLVWLIAGANVANLLLFRGIRRQGDTAVHRAFGAAPSRIVRRALTESVLLACAGGVLGIAVAMGLVRLFRGTALPAVSADLGIFTVDWRVVAFAIGGSLLAGTVFGLVPAVLGGRTDMVNALHDAGRPTTGRQSRTQAAFSIMQVAASVTLVVGALLLGRTLLALSRVDPGFDPSGLSVFWVDPRELGYENAQTARYYRELLRRVDGLPGVDGAAVGYNAPFAGMGWVSRVHRPDQPADAALEVYQNRVSPTYFATLGIPTVRGRVFQDDEFLIRDEDLHSIVVSRRLAERLFGHTDVVGRTVRFPPAYEREARDYTVIGVVGDAAWGSLDEKPKEFLYLPMTFEWANRGALMVRSAQPPGRVAAMVRETAAELERDLPLYRVESLTESIARRHAVERLFAKLIGVLALTALILAAIGLYGVIAYGVAARTREFGVRRAMGADQRGILEMVLGRAAGLAGIGVALGLAGAVGLARLLANRLFGVTPLDPATYAAAAALLGVVTLVASYVPARAATRVDPAEALRSE